MARIFISYSRVDESFARKLAGSLSELGADIWIDVEDIPAGMKWSSAIQQGLRQCEAMIVILSPDSIASPNVEDEWQDFLDNHKPVIPVLMRPVKLTDIHFQLRRIQYIDFQRQSYEAALKQLRAELDRKGTPLAPVTQVTPPTTDVPRKVSTPPSPSVSWWRSPIFLAAVAVVIIGALLVAVLTLNNPPPNASNSTLTALAQAIPATNPLAPSATPTLEVAYMVQTLDSQSTDAAVTRAALDATQTAAQWTPTPSASSTPSPNYTASIDAFTTARAATAQVLTDQQAATSGALTATAQYLFDQQTTINAATATAQYLLDQQATISAATATPAPTNTLPPTLVPTPLPSGQKVIINWLVGLGTGTNPDQIDVENQVVNAFNATHPNIELQLTMLPLGSDAQSELTMMIARGDAPDIVGPVGDDGANAFANYWLDLQPLVDRSGYDLGQFPQKLVEFYRRPEGLVALPFAVFPALLFYNKDLFDEAGLAYPPSQYGETYDGKTWDYQTLTDLARSLTVDKNGNDATSAAFDPNNIVQWGFNHQWAFSFDEFATFGTGRFYDRDTGQAVIPDNWRAEANWYYDAIWNQHIAPTANQETDMISSSGAVSAFSSGRIAMARTHVWYTCCLADMQANWDIAALPSYNGQYTSNLNSDTFRILNTTQNPDAAFEVLSYLVGDGAVSLVQSYREFPARESLRDAYIAHFRTLYTQDINWQVVTDSLNYIDLPPVSAAMPYNQLALNRIGAFQTLMHGTPGVNVDAELDTLRNDLESIFTQGG